MLLIYQELFERSEKTLSTLIEYGILNNPAKGRFIEYKRILNEFRDAQANKNDTMFRKKYSIDKAIFAFKELLELTDILEPMLSIYNSLSKENKSAIKNKIKIIFSGPIFPENENIKNNIARNYQFEIRLASKLIKVGYNNISFERNPDITITVNGRVYFFECKRIFGVAQRAVGSNVLKAIKQLKNNNNKYFCGIVALDISPQFVKGHDFIGGTSVSAVSNFLKSELTKYIFNLRERIKEINKAAKENNIVVLLLNISALYVLFDYSETGGIEETTILAFNKENIRAGIFGMDFSKLKLTQDLNTDITSFYC